MDITMIFKIAGVGLLITVINQVLTRAGREEQATLVTLVGVVIVLTMVINMIGRLFQTVKTTFML